MKDKIITFLGGAVLAIVAIIGVAYLGSDYKKETINSKDLNTGKNDSHVQTSNDYNFKTGLKLDQFPKNLVENGIVDLEKYRQLAGEMPAEESQILESNNSKEEIIINQNNNQFFLNLFWGLGLAQENKYLVELRSYKDQNQLDGLASTGGWNIANGSASDHFSMHNFLNLTDEQQKKVADIASTIYRPCCGNSARFADCNHGMAMLGVLSLGVSQGLSDDQLYNLALKFNSVWFPDQYSQMAQYFKVFEKKETNQVDPKIVLSAKFSSGQGFSQNIEKPLATLNNPSAGPQSGGGSCSL
ncbi:MAG: hypothetical protein WC705_03195 [Candidatus Paceibacterota bacterium]|jgi:hypothetical protein